ncbi:MAG: hemin-degrading factor [Burkholderiales bacterium]
MQVETRLAGDPAALRRAWAALSEQSALRIRDAAQRLGVSEAGLLATKIGETVTRLHGDFRGAVKRAGELGRVMALTRNEHVVHEKDGRYENIHAEQMIGMALGQEIDLRLFFSRWKLGYAVCERKDGAMQRSLQFFDADGTAVHKIFLRPTSNVDAFERIVADFKSPNQQAGERVAESGKTTNKKPDAEVDVGRFHDDWVKMSDTHQFFGLLKKHGMSRTQALRLIGNEFAYAVALDSARTMLDAARARAVSIMCFVGNAGCIQIHTGPITSVRVMGPWLNVLDPGFNLHLREDHIAQAWVVKKPTSEGIVTSLELFAEDGETMTLFFGERKPGIPEREDWRALIAELKPLKP